MHALGANLEVGIDVVEQDAITGTRGYVDIGHGERRAPPAGYLVEPRDHRRDSLAAAVHVHPIPRVERIEVGFVELPSLIAKDLRRLKIRLLDPNKLRCLRPKQHIRRVRPGITRDEHTLGGAHMTNLFTCRLALILVVNHLATLQFLLCDANDFIRKDQ